jgi:hypothetical protein
MKQGTSEDWEERRGAGSGSRLCWRRQEATKPPWLLPCCLEAGGGGCVPGTEVAGRVKGWLNACAHMESWAKLGYQRWAWHRKWAHGAKREFGLKKDERASYLSASRLPSTDNSTGIGISSSAFSSLQWRAHSRSTPPSPRRLVSSPTSPRPEPSLCSVEGLGFRSTAPRPRLARSRTLLRGPWRAFGTRSPTPS